eukprot:342294-Pyramimonas_sp.AAC.1
MCFDGLDVVVDGVEVVIQSGDLGGASDGGLPPVLACFRTLCAGVPARRLSAGVLAYAAGRRAP